MITLEEKPIAVPGSLPHDIIVGRKVIGELKPSLNYDGKVRWHAAINLSFGIIGLIQGFGETHAEAIADAIKCFRRDAAAAVLAVDAFEREIG